MTSDAFDQQVKRYRRLFLSIARRIIGNDDDAEDIVQDTLIDAWLKISEGAIIIRSFPAYVGKMTEFRARRTLWLRKERKYQEVSLEDWDAASSECVGRKSTAFRSSYELPHRENANSCSIYSTDDVVVHKLSLEENSKEVLSLAKTSRLTDKQLTRVWQRYYYEMTDQQIADYEGVTQQSVNVGIRSATLALQRAARVSRAPPV